MHCQFGFKFCLFGAALLHGRMYSFSGKKHHNKKFKTSSNTWTTFQDYGEHYKLDAAYFHVNSVNKPKIWPKLLRIVKCFTQLRVAGKRKWQKKYRNSELIQFHGVFICKTSRNDVRSPEIIRNNFKPCQLSTKHLVSMVGLFHFSTWDTVANSHCNSFISQLH